MGKKRRRKNSLPPPKNNDCSNNTSSQTTTRDRKHFWYGLLLELSIETSLHCAHIFPSMSLFQLKKKKKKGSRLRCVIKCNLNWMANAGRRIELILSDGYLGQMLTSLEQHSRLSFIDIHTTCWLVRLCMHQNDDLTFEKKREKRKNGKATTWNV